MKTAMAVKYRVGVKYHDAVENKTTVWRESEL